VTLRERQDGFVETFDQLPDWSERFQFLIDHSSLLVASCPSRLIPFRLENCQSRTFFSAETRDGLIHVDGWSNSAIMGGLIAVCMKIFEGVPVAELAHTPVDFHIRSGLVTNMTPMRTDSLREIVRRINDLSVNS
jgi:cysteine desulfuration protein SufE